jgi:hypothetical protein
VFERSLAGLTTDQLDQLGTLLELVLGEGRGEGQGEGRGEERALSA